MSIIRGIVGLLFVFFLLYTCFYILQWLSGLFVASDRLAKSNDRKKIISYIYPKEFFKQHPLSVLIPAYNEEACIVETVLSLCNQEYPGLSIIVVDDGSKDDTSERMISYFQMKPSSCSIEQTIPTEKIHSVFEASYQSHSILLIQKDNGGKSDALNCAINACKTQRCVVLDADTQVAPDALSILMVQCLNDQNIVVCAGAVSTQLDFYQGLSFFQKALLYFQKLEYARTFYMQRILLDQMNGNIVVSGAFAMFDTAVLKAIGGYKRDTIGEDMEIAMRIHSFFASQKKSYKISYVPEAVCYTQFPFHYRDYFKQRRRWHIGMVQSMKSHRYMCGNVHYGWIGLLSGTMYMLYELYTPFIELAGLFSLMLTFMLDLLDCMFVFKITILYLFFIVVTQAVLIWILNMYDIEPFRLRTRILIIGVSVLEFFLFHPMNTIVKLIAFTSYQSQKKQWGCITRAKGSMISQ